MALDYSDLYLIHAMDDRNNIRTRAKTIEDNFGIKTKTVEQYRDEHGGFGFLKAIGIAAIGVVAGGVVAAASLGVLAPVGGLLAMGGLIAGGISLAMQNEKTVKGYSEYLDQASAQGRAMRDGRANLSQNVEYDNGAGKKVTYVNDLNAARQQQVLAQNTR